MIIGRIKVNDMDNNFLSMIGRPGFKSFNERYIDEIKEDNKPVVILGASLRARWVYDYLMKYGINISSFCVTSEYYKSNMTLNGLDVLPFEKLGDYYDKCDLVIGFEAPHPMIEIIDNSSEYSFISKAFVLDQIDVFFEMTPEFIEDNKIALSKTYDLLEDEISKKLFIAYIGEKSNYIKEEYPALRELYTADEYWNDYYDLNQKEHVLIDCGAYDGDSVQDFIDFVGESGNYKVYAFEPDRYNFKKLKANFDNDDNIIFINKAVGEKKGKMFFDMKGNTGSRLTDVKSAKTVMVDVTAVDDEIEGNVTFIKMDIEGAELSALKGMQNIIIENLPVIACCVYHKVDDLIVIPQFIHELTKDLEGRGYRFYLKQHAYISEDLILYAVPRWDEIDDR